MSKEQLPTTGFSSAVQNAECMFVMDLPFISDGKDWVDVAAAFFPVIISAVAIYFTWAQFELAKKQRKDDLFDRRFDLYNRTVEWTKRVGGIKEGYTENLHDELSLILREGQFIFGGEFFDLIQEAGEKFKGAQNFEETGKNQLIESNKYFAKIFPEKLYDVVEPALRKDGTA